MHSPASAAPRSRAFGFCTSTASSARDATRRNILAGANAGRRNEALAAGCPLDQAEPYGDCLTYSLGHYDTWAHWRRNRTVDPDLRAIIRSYEYEDMPRVRAFFFQVTGDHKLCDQNSILVASAIGLGLPIMFVHACDPFRLSRCSLNFRQHASFWTVSASWDSFCDIRIPILVPYPFKAAIRCDHRH